LRKSRRFYPQPKNGKLALPIWAIPPALRSSHSEILTAHLGNQWRLSILSGGDENYSHAHTNHGSLLISQLSSCSLPHFMEFHPICACLYFSKGPPHVYFWLSFLYVAPNSTELCSITYRQLRLPTLQHPSYQCIRQLLLTCHLSLLCSIFLSFVLICFSILLKYCIPTQTKILELITSIFFFYRKAYLTPEHWCASQEGTSISFHRTPQYETRIPVALYHNCSFSLRLPQRLSFLMAMTLFHLFSRPNIHKDDLNVCVHPLSLSLSLSFSLTHTHTHTHTHTESISKFIPQYNSLKN
jgi:hypothetical protein